MLDVFVKSIVYSGGMRKQDGRYQLLWKQHRAVITAVFIVLLATLFPLTILASGETQVIRNPQPSVAALEITVTKLPRVPVLFFLESKNSVKEKKLSVDNTHAQITSSMAQFYPPLQVLPVGVTIDVVNHDPVLHNTHVFSANRTVFNVAMPSPYITVQRTFSRPGLFGVRCDLHPSMNAWIAVVSDANYAIIEKPDVYRIENIEPGRYEVHIQRPERQEQIHEIELVAGEERKIQLPP